METQLGSYSVSNKNIDWDWVLNVIDWLGEAIGWLAKEAWNEELLGSLTNGTASGGPLDEFAIQTGEYFPDLQAKRQAAVDAWKFYLQWHWPWEHTAREKADAYLARCKEFASALEAKMREYAGLPTAGVEWLSKWWPYVLAGGIGISGVGLAIWKFRK